MTSRGSAVGVVSDMSVRESPRYIQRLKIALGEVRLCAPLHDDAMPHRNKLRTRFRTIDTEPMLIR